MSHLVHDVVGHMAVNHPVAGGVRVEFDIPRLADSNQYRGLWPLGRKGNILAVSRRDPKVVTVQVNGVVAHLTQVAESDPDFIAGFTYQRVGRWETFAVHRQDVEVTHYQGIGA